MKRQKESTAFSKQDDTLVPKDAVLVLFDKDIHISLVDLYKPLQRGFCFAHKQGIFAPLIYIKNHHILCLQRYVNTISSVFELTFNMPNDRLSSVGF